MTPEGKPALGAQPRPYLRTPFDERWGRFSPEAPPCWVAYLSDKTGRDQVYIAAFPEPRGKFRISPEGGLYPQWGAGRRELFPTPAVDLASIPYDETADGRFLVRATPSQAGQPLTVIVNCPALLKKEAPVLIVAPIVVDATFRGMLP